MKIHAALLLAAVFTAPGCLAHATLEQAEPAPRTEFSSSPPYVLLKFNEAVEAGYSSITVETAAGKLVGPTELDAPEPQSLQLTLPLLQPGKYIVRYRVLSADGHVIDDSYPFSVRAPEPGQ